MLFSSSVFLFLFLPAVVVIYYGPLNWNRTLQNLFLFVVSILFYAYGEPKFVLVMLLSIFLNWILGLLVDKFRKNKAAARGIIFAALLVNLGIIFVFKYLMFTCEVINSLFSSDIEIPEIALPIGISFFTFQALSYVVDVYRENGVVQKNPFYVGLYISFFPQLIAGPIVRYETVSDEILHRKENFKDFTEGCYRFMIGFCKKVLLSNNLAIIVQNSYSADLHNLSMPMAWLGSIAYTLQIFFDFSGYSDMAIGLGRMFGFHFLENFNYPYVSKSVSEFWRRWHISLGSFFRDYVYIPLGGSRVSEKRLIFNLFVVWLLTGIWHGANWTFLAWGLYYFIFLVIEKMLIIHSKKKEAVKSFRGVPAHIYTLFVVNIGWVLFNSPSLKYAINYLKCMFLGDVNFHDSNFILYLNEYKVYILAAIVFCIPWKGILEKHKLPKILDVGVQVSLGIVVPILFIVAETFLVKGTYNPFIYFNF